MPKVLAPLPGGAQGRAGRAKGRTSSLSYLRSACALGGHAAVKANTSPFVFVSSCLGSQALPSPEPRLIFMQRPRLAGAAPRACIRCCYRPEAALPRSPSVALGCLSAMVSELCSCHSEKHNSPSSSCPLQASALAFLGPSQSPAVPGGLRNGVVYLQCLVPAPQAAGDGASGHLLPRQQRTAVEAAPLQEPGFYWSTFFSSRQPG